VKPEWQTVQIVAPTEQVLWNVSQLALEKENFPLQGAPDRSERRMISGWKTSLSVFRRPHPGRVNIQPGKAGA
jgi:hypothetical protein